MPDDLPVRIFVSYARDDRRWVDRNDSHHLIPHLISSLRKLNVEVWFDAALVASEVFKRTIEQEIRRADIAILLVSQSFLNSEFIEAVELPEIIKRTDDPNFHVVPILIGYSDWQELEILAERQVLPGPPPTPLIDYTTDPAKWDKVRYDITTVIKNLVNRTREHRAAQAATVKIAVVGTASRGKTGLRKSDREIQATNAPKDASSARAEQDSQPPRFVFSLPPNSVPCAAWTLPPVTLLSEPVIINNPADDDERRLHAQMIEATLQQFNVPATLVEATRGPRFTRYEVQLALGVKVSKIVALADNMAVILAVAGIRMEAPIAGKSAIGIEVPNARSGIVTLRECVDHIDFRSASAPLTVALGRTVDGKRIYANIAALPHVLMGGATNSGKSACLHAMIASLLLRLSPSEVRFVLVDPKRVEFCQWEGIPHLLCPIVTDMGQVNGVFASLLAEMDRRYDLLAAAGVRNITGYNSKCAENDRLPFIVLIVDEFADIMLRAGREIEPQVCRLAQLARATGIHMIISTQRPSVDVITGTIKANISGRIAFAVASSIDSRTILDRVDAAKLLGAGDMLYMPIDASAPVRVQGCYISEMEVSAIATHVRANSGTAPKSAEASIVDEPQLDALYEAAVGIVVAEGSASTSLLQRRLSIGFIRSKKLLSEMEMRGVVGPADGVRARKVLITPPDSPVNDDAGKPTI